MMILFLKLLLAHLLGDFVLQPTSWVQRRKERVSYLLLHVAVHGGLLFLFLLPEIAERWQTVIFIACTHLVIDSLKIYGEKRWPFKPFLLFIADQALHIAALLAVLLYEYGIPSEWQQLLLSPKAMLYAIAFVLVTAASPVMLRVFFSKWTKDLDFLHKHQNSLADAGLLIGIMERLLIVLFIQLNFLSGIGFLLGAKSIFRFGDLTNAKDTKFTEYILVGTLASFVVGIAIGYALRWGLRYVA
ncbi:uncharacterized protein DUF3307 [Sphingobacterium allocomposti]|uniref:Uncharacterized protein DUF3307 n=1 Tax=Sphingobacterium allocomposti TaxID=415956 RepID=A0A5S5DKM7_9SPHI|nr:DUF3307 domain-containing protein [Sphingobacterium composti Yoo et al. 2007 non Ten et al. 2007]TYP95706.1 uncharacterized protein DUF3307 [Sphingobacterium composti Yoo et al. 2007 non Ten et al. 2007]HLS96596.1 DUF3307 domain-containing protein [Sphingobacterium sp.]